MPLETGTYLNSLVAANPAHDDQLSASDSHIRLLKAVLLATFPNLNAAVTATPADLNALAGNVSSLQSQITAEASSRSAAVASEAVTRGNGDTALATSISNEASTRAALSTHVDASVASLQAQITAEASSRTSADTGLQGQINTITGTTIPTLMPFGSIQFAGAGNGVYARIPNSVGTSFIIQAGVTGALATGNGDGVSFPIPFPTSASAVIVSNATPGNLTVSGTLPGGAGPASGFLAYAKTASTGTAAPGASVFFIAMGF